MKIIQCDECGDPLIWAGALCDRCLKSLQECKWQGLIKRSNKYFGVNDEVRSLYPDFDQLDEGWGL